MGRIRLVVSLGNNGYGAFMITGLFIRALDPQGIISINNSHNSPFDRDLLPLKPLGVSGPVPALVMVESKLPSGFEKWVMGID